MASMWRKTLEYLGLVEGDEYDYGDAPADEQAQGRQQRPRAAAAPPAEAPARPEPSNVRRIPSASNRQADGDGLGSSSVRPVPSNKVHVTNPSTFNDVEEVGDRFRNGIPVIMNLAGASEGVAKRLLDFASGLIFGLDGRIERVGDRVFLLTPVGVDVSTEERARLEQRGFFNQA